ncbi:hypothetical protein Tco_0298677 [Tanacetum coccineum]
MVWRGLSEMIPIALNCATRGIPGLAPQPAGLQEGLGGPVRDSRVSSSKTLLGNGPADCTGAPVGCFVKAFNAPSGSILAGVWGSQVAGTIAEETGGMLAVCVGIEDDDGLDIDWEVENKSPPNIAVENEDDRPGLARPPRAEKLRPPTPCDGRGPEVAASLTDFLEVQNTVQKVEPLN